MNFERLNDLGYGRLGEIQLFGCLREVERFRGDNKPFLLDVRTEKEWNEEGYLEGSALIPINDLWGRLAELPGKDARIVVLCKSGHCGALAIMALRMNGYTDVVNLAGGLNAWLTAELPVAK